MHIGEKIKILRSEMSITQKDLADGIGVSNVMVSMYEQGKKEPSAQTIVRIARFLGGSADYLLDTDPAMDKETRQLLDLAKNAKKYGISFEDIELTIETIIKLKKGKDHEN